MDQEAREGTMIGELSDLPAGVIGFEASGRIRAEDYRDVVLPALERAAATGGGRVAGPQGGHRAPPGVEAHRTGDRHRVDARADQPVRLDDARGDEDLP